MNKGLLARLSAVVGVILIGLMIAGEARAGPIPPPKLDQMLAPIALYPDRLIAEILVAATYPVEIVEAVRWVQEPDHSGLRDDELINALAPQDWDPSVKSLITFPKILQMMNSHMAWTQELGDAFLAQQADVMASIQRLRNQAQTAGTLASSPQELVDSDGVDTTIEPADPTQVYVPVYNPAVVYGDWQYPDYPPYYFGESEPFVETGLGYSVFIVRPLWGWGSFDWRHHRIHVNLSRFNAINRTIATTTNHPPPASTIWQHDSYHRRGVAYRDADAGRFSTRISGVPVNANAQPVASPVSPPVQIMIQQNSNPRVGGKAAAPVATSPVPPMPSREVTYTAPPVRPEPLRAAPSVPVEPHRLPVERPVAAMPMREAVSPPPVFGHMTPGGQEGHLTPGHEGHQSLQPLVGSNPAVPRPTPPGPKPTEPPRAESRGGEGHR